MFKFLTTIVLLVAMCQPCSAAFWVKKGGPVAGGGGGGDGRVGVATTATNTSTGQAPTSQRTFTSEFVATDSGPVSYAFIDLGYTDARMGHIRPTIFDSSGNLLSTSSNCTGTNVAGAVYRYAITEISITSGITYKIGFASGASLIMRYVSAGSGTIWADTTSYTSDVCPASVDDPITDNVNYGSVYSFVGTIKVWVSNDANDY